MDPERVKEQLISIPYMCNTVLCLNLAQPPQMSTHCYNLFKVVHNSLGDLCIKNNLTIQSFPTFFTVQLWTSFFFLGFGHWWLMMQMRCQFSCIWKASCLFYPVGSSLSLYFPGTWYWVDICIAPIAVNARVLRNTVAGLGSWETSIECNSRTCTREKEERRR